MRETPELEEYKFNNNKYDYIILGTPVWASTFAPPIRTFVKENKEKLKNKKFSVFVCYSGGGAEKAIAKLKDYIEIKDFDAQLILIDPKDKESDENLRKINEFCKKITK